ncbi:MAG: TetR/AcrR family transcriptional regulator [Thermodesulfobacteriota bacterium]
MRPKTDARRLQMKSSALAVFCAKGYTAATVSDIARRAKVAHGTFYLYYDSKKAAFLDLMEDFARTVLSCFDELSTAQMPESGATADDLAGLLRRGYSAYFSLISENRRLARLFFRESALAEPDLARKRAEIIAEFAARAEVLTRRGREVGLLPEINAPVAALAVVGIIERVTAAFVSENNRFTEDELARELARFEVFGIAGKGGSHED